MLKNQLQVYTASKDSVEKALELFLNAKINQKRKKSKENEEEALDKFSHYCSQSLSNSKKKNTALAFSPSFALTEMRLCLMRHDWVNLQRLFPQLLEFSRDKEILIWRYALTILLHSPMSSPGNIEEFLSTCIGCKNDNLDYVLEQLITLRVDGKDK